MRYYYPLSTKDFSFENIFATESLSPYVFYNKRGFGIDYFYKLTELQLDEVLVLYNEPPVYSLAENSGDAVKYIVSFSDESIDADELIFIAEGIFGYPKTVYFNQTDLQVLFLKERDQRFAVLKSETSLPTKGLAKYEGNFKIIDENNCKPFNLPDHEKLNFVNEHFPYEIALDRRYNSFKGFLYGITIGLIGSKSKEEIVLKKRIQEVINSFAELKNRSDYTYKPYEKSPRGAGNGSRAQTEMYEHRLQVSIIECEAVFSAIFPGQKFERNNLVKFLYEKFRHMLPTFEAAENYVNYALLDEEIFGATKLSMMKSYFFRNTISQNPLAYFELLKDQAERFFKNTRSNYPSKTNRETSEDSFKEVIYTIEKFVDQQFLIRAKSKKFDVAAIQYDYQTNQVKIDDRAGIINKESLQEFLLISNCILSMPKIGKSEDLKLRVLPIVETVGNLLSKGKHTKTSQLYQYLNNEINVYSLEKVSSVVMQNFVAFVFNPDSIEKLENFTETKGIEERWMSFAFWCAYNGFANTSKNFVKPIFESGNRDLQRSIDLHLRNQFSNIQKFSINLPQEQFTAPSEEPIIKPANETIITPTDENDPVLKSRGFYDKFIAKIYDISFSDFHDLILQNDRDILLRDLKARSKASKKDIEKMISRYNDMVNNNNLF